MLRHESHLKDYKPTKTDLKFKSVDIKKSIMNKLAVCFLLFSAVLHIGTAMECYKCTTVDNPECGDPFIADTIETMDCTLETYGTISKKSSKYQTKDEAPFCVVYTGIDADGDVHTVRSCSLQGSDSCELITEQAEEEGSNITACAICDSDLCNSATSVYLLPALLTSVITALYIIN